MNFEIQANDIDGGENGKIRYAVEGTNRFGIHPETGLLHLLAYNDQKNEVDNLEFCWILELIVDWVSSASNR